MKIDHALDVLEKGKEAYIESTSFYYPDFGVALETAIDFMKLYILLEDDKEVLQSLKIIKIKGDCMRQRYANCPSNFCSNCDLFVPEGEFEKAITKFSEILSSL